MHRDLKPRPPFAVVLALIERIERETPDLIVVFGGDSAIDLSLSSFLVVEMPKRC